MAQNPDTVYYNKKYSPVPKSKAAYMKIISRKGDILTTRLIDIKHKTETVQHLRNNKPVGKWIVEENNRTFEYDFDNLVYLTDDEVKKEVQRINGNITETTPGFVKPSFIGGDEARIKFIIENIYYPLEARENGYQGTIYLCFTVTKEGNIENVAVTKGANVYLDCEAVRVVKLMPKWNPATLNEKPIDILYFMPIKFTLAG